MKVAIYCRLSDEDKGKLSQSDDSNSILNQKIMLTQYALQQDWEIFNIYSDDDYTGADRNRPAFKQLLEDAEKHMFDIILCKTQSRFTRELELVEKYIHGLFPQWGIRFISIVDNADTANKGNKKSRQINALVNEWYLEDMSDNIRSVLTSRRKNGLHIGSFALYGYLKDPNQKGHLIVDEEAAATVREIFALYANGYGKTAIARILNDRGVPNPTEYKRQHGMRYQSASGTTATLWRYDTISTILRNEMYIGNMVQGRYGSISYKSKINKPRPKESWYIVKGTHQAIIDYDLWMQVQSILEQKCRPFSSGQIGIFAGKVKCLHCGSTMRSVKKKDHRYLQCTTKYLSSNACRGAFVSEDKLTQIVLSKINELSSEYLNLDELTCIIDINVDSSTQIQNLKVILADYQRRLNSYQTCLQEIYLDKINHIITEEEFTELLKSLRHNIKYAESMIVHTEIQLNNLPKNKTQSNEIRQQIEHHVYPKQLSRVMIDGLIDHITVGKRIAGSHNIPVTVYWNF